MGASPGNDDAEVVAVGDRFDALFRAEFVGIARTAYLIVGDRRLAEEVAQEAFARAWARWKRIAHHDRPGAWVQTVAVRLALRTKSRASRGAELEASESGRRMFAEADESLVDLVDLLRELSPMQRAAIALGVLEDLPAEDVAARLGCRPSTARVHLHRGRQKLAELIKEAPRAH
jgi:RNA polymerase sigma-70 factor (ECF subfamily)